MNNRFKKAFFAVLAVSVFVFLQTAYTLPEHIMMLEGEEHSINIPYPFSLSEVSEAGGNFTKTNTNTLMPQNQGSYNFDFRLMGIPFKSATVDVVKPMVVIPGGQAVGIKLYINGLLVVGLSDIESGEKTLSPGKAAGIESGDLITEINNKRLESAADLSRIIQEGAGGEVEATIIRDGKPISKKITPVYYDGSGDYKIGVWVRDSAAGIGTITFINPDDNSFGALGHGISDVDTGDIINIKNGEITGCSISSIIRGEVGSPGELRGTFDGNTIGDITVNRDDGIFGKIENAADESEAIPIALRTQVRTGEAHIYSSINGSEVEKYSIIIERTSHQSKRSAKGMVIRVTDERLLEKTGGIVQGMSGSPIIQDGRLAGVVTHVFVSDPTRGYGMFSEWMVESLAEVKNAIN